MFASYDVWEPIANCNKMHLIVGAREKNKEDVFEGGLWILHMVEIWVGHSTQILECLPIDVNGEGSCIFCHGVIGTGHQTFLGHLFPAFKRKS